MDIVAELERAASVLMAPPAAVSEDDRRVAEQMFIQLRKSHKPYEFCKKLLEVSHVDYVLFEAATTVKEAIIREWTLLKKDEIDGICQFLLACATEKPSLQSYVREQILHVVAIIFKLGTMEAPEARTNLIAGLSRLVNQGNKTMELICCSIMKALLTEYSITTQSTNFGMSMEFHSKCKKSFEEKDLRNVFLLTVQILQKYASEPLSTLSRQDIAIFIRSLSLAEQVLHWEFLAGSPLLFSLYRYRSEAGDKTLFRAHKSWKSVILDPSLLDLFFKLQRVCVAHDELLHHCMQCLVQLASVTGDVFSEDVDQLKYLVNFIAGFLKIVEKNEWKSHEAFGVASIIFRLVDIYPVSVFLEVPKDLRNTFFQAMTYLACTFQELAVSTDLTLLNDNEFKEAANLVLDAWMVVVSHAAEFDGVILSGHAVKIFDVFLATHLAPPDGKRKAEGENNNLEEIECEIEMDDREAFADELSDIACLSRLALGHVLPILTEKIDRRHHLLKDLLAKEMLGHDVSESHAADELFEDLHWLVLFSAFVLSIDTPGETSDIPEEVCELANQHMAAHPHAIQASMNYVMSIGEADATGVDPVVKLFVAIFKVAVLETRFLKNNLGEAFSPEVASTLLWFLKRFVKAYLFQSGDTHLKLSPSLTALFGEESECGKWLIASILEIIEENLKGWCAEPQVSEDVVRLLLRLVNDKCRTSVCLTFPHLWSIARKFSVNAPEVAALSSAVYRHLVESLMRASLQIEDPASRTQFQSQFLDPIIRQYQSTRGSSDFHKICHEEGVKQQVLRTIDCARGVVAVRSPQFANEMFEYLEPLLADAVPLLKEYEDYADVVEDILELFVDVVDCLICVLSQQHTNRLCELCLRMMEAYAKFNLVKVCNVANEEEDKYRELLLLMQLLTHVLSKDYLDLSTDASHENDVMVPPVDVVLFGLRVILPLMSAELLKFPNLSSEYFKLVTFVCEVYPEKVKSLPSDLFQNFMASLQAAVSDFGPEIMKCALDAISMLAKYASNECDASDGKNDQLFTALRYFLNALFQHVVMGAFNMDLIESASEALFLLICCNQQEYLHLARNLIDRQHVTDENFKQRLTDAFQILTPGGLQLTPNRTSLKQFRKNLEEFLRNVKGFLCFK